ncbi:Lysophospholipase L1 [Paenibacillus sp. 1_12]|uniref:SGNH/GDSL hydrolase family protein n=1 Tax=Paenibacillus sp. 1_12 TaxID=1566278 RepID=UPI0008F2DC6F|nr:SGNH/GDSL hydrolase family protein [Paenibacillus sp. 1_12]SFL35713.1 Lysophospholipase L1 [Paenibacillus sp. 1_12]
MIFNDLEFHNVAHLQQAHGVSGLLLQRFPQKIRYALGTEDRPNGRFVAEQSTGCEIRFVTEARILRVVLTATLGEGDVVIYNGDYVHSVHRLVPGRVHTLQLEKNVRFGEVHKQALDTGRFSSDVWRIAISRNYEAGIGFQVAFHHLETFGHAHRPPHPQELPGKTLLAYGSSITHGSGATVHHNAYIQQTARRLGFDILNKGMGGSCLCEAEMADFLADQPAWDVATLELGVNMREIFSTEEFKSRARYLIEQIVTKNIGKPVFLITLFPNSSDHLVSEAHPLTLANEQFSQAIRELHHEFALPHLHLIEGHDILNDFSALAADLIHPSDYGHILMGERLAKRMSELL